jgi:5-methylcytosine-specific restriction endonuclease McrA
MAKKSAIQQDRSNHKNKCVVVPFDASTKKTTSPYKKGTIPKALRETLWIKSFGKKFEAKCSISWCLNKITVYDFHAGHNIPECKGGQTVLENLVPICSRCNLSMGSQYSIKEWEKLGSPISPWKCWLVRLFQCWSSKPSLPAPQQQTNPS